MGKLIPFERGRDARSKNQALPAGMLNRSVDTGPIFDLKGELATVDVEISKLLLIRVHLNALQGRVSRNAVVMARQNLKHVSTEALNDIVRKSTKDQWSRHPGYFQALIDEIGSRL